VGRADSRKDRITEWRPIDVPGFFLHFVLFRSRDNHKTYRFVQAWRSILVLEADDKGGFVNAATHELVPRCGKITKILPRYINLIS
jgi:transposase-like protein